MRQYKVAAATDALTEVLNRRGFLEAASELMARRSRDQEPVSVLAFDLDHFKSINDRFGHHVGDATLRLFAKMTRTTMRTNDVIGRWGGEEFVALVPGSLADAAAAAERVRVAFQRAAVEFDGHEIACDGEHWHCLRFAERQHRGADRARRCRDVPRQDQRPKPHRGRRRSSGRQARARLGLAASRVRCLRGQRRKRWRRAESMQLN